VDANWMSDEGLWSFRLADVTKYSMRCDTTITFAVFLVAMNKEKWKSLTPNQQKIIEEATSKLRENHLRQWDIEEAKIVEWAKKEKGVQFITLSAEEQRRWGEKVKPMAEEYVQKTEKLGLPGEEAIKFSTEYIKTHQ
jgi:TRAP-type C4-dicarboxylate transport system substrate-binding protein